MTHAAESTHYYTRTGEPAYTVTAKAGHQRPTTVADARKLGLVPSVTEIIKCCNKPGLTNWMVDQGILAALTLPKIDGEREEDWLKRVKHDSKETARKAAEKGTTIHGALQGHYEGTATPEFWPYIEGATKAIDDWHFQADDEWCAESSFAAPLGFGGKVDLSCAGFVLDFKTKEFGKDDDLRTWDEHAMQIAAYRHGLGMPSARGAICYVSVTNPGLAKLIEIPEKDLANGWRMFCGLLAYWKAKNDFEPGWMTEAA